MLHKDPVDSSNITCCKIRPVIIASAGYLQFRIWTPQQVSSKQQEAAVAAVAAVAAGGVDAYYLTTALSLSVRFLSRALCQPLAAYPSSSCQGTVASYFGILLVIPRSSNGNSNHHIMYCMYKVVRRESKTANRHDPITIRSRGRYLRWKDLLITES